MNLLAPLGAACLMFVVWFTWWASTSRCAGPGQTRREAITEAWTSLAVGFAINYGMNIVVIPLMTDGCHTTPGGNFWGGWIYTGVSIVRQFFIRRAFNAMHHRKTA